MKNVSLRVMFISKSSQTGHQASDRECPMAVHVGRCCGTVNWWITVVQTYSDEHREADN